jgi:hypothetical protein
MRSFALMTLALAAASAIAQDAALLLGLEDRDEGATTVFVQRMGVATFAREVGPGYWLWRDSGFLKVTVEGQGSEGASAVVLTPTVGTVTRINGEVGRPETHFVVGYVSEFGIGVRQSMAPREIVASRQGGEVRFNEVKRYPSVFKNFAWTDLQTTVDVAQAFTEKVAADFHSIAQSIGVTDAAHDREASPTNWTLLRDEGRWQLYGSLFPAEGQSNAGPRLFPVAPVTDPRHGASKLDGPKWVRVRSEYPDAIDATTSPDGKLTVIVTPDTTFVHESSGPSLGKRVQSVRVPAGRVVMTQWLDGAAAAKAASALSKH